MTRGAAIDSTAGDGVWRALVASASLVAFFAIACGPPAPDRSSVPIPPDLRSAVSEIHSAFEPAPCGSDLGQAVEKINDLVARELWRKGWRHIDAGAGPYPTDVPRRVLAANAVAGLVGRLVDACSCEEDDVATHAARGLLLLASAGAADPSELPPEWRAVRTSLRAHHASVMQLAESRDGRLARLFLRTLMHGWPQDPGTHDLLRRGLAGELGVAPRLIARDISLRTQWRGEYTELTFLTAFDLPADEAEALLQAVAPLVGAPSAQLEAALRLSVRGGDHARSRAALYILRSPHGLRCIDDVQFALDNGSDDLRAVAALAIGAMGPAAKQALPSLLTALRETTDSTVRRSVLSAVDDLRDWGPEVEEAVMDVAEQLEMDVNQTALYCIGILAKGRAADDRTLKWLRRLESSPYAGVRARAAEALQVLQSD